MCFGVLISIHYLRFIINAIFGLFWFITFLNSLVHCLLIIPLLFILSLVYWVILSINFIICHLHNLSTVILIFSYKIVISLYEMLMIQKGMTKFKYIVEGAPFLLLPGLVLHNNIFYIVMTVSLIVIWCSKIES